MRYPWANIALLIVLLFQLATGFGGLISGSQRLGWVLWLHSVGSYAVVLLLFWKGTIIWHSFRRRPSLSVSRLGFVVLTLLLLVILVTGFAWTVAGPIYLFGMSLMVIHGLVSILLILLLAWHIVARRFIFRVPTSHDRRAWLRLAGISLVGFALWRFVEPAKAMFNMPGARRRFTGSYETGSFTGVFPPTSWLFDYPQPVDSARWRLVIDGAVERPLTFTYAQLEQLAAHAQTATLDCTGGWYTVQEWTGLPLAQLLDVAGVVPSARSITVTAVSGYGRRFGLPEARTYLLATHVAGEPLSHGHGFPVRLVAPGHRGFDWVKWVTHIRVNETSHLWQPPAPLQ